MIEWVVEIRQQSLAKRTVKSNTVIVVWCGGVVREFSRGTSKKDNSGGSLTQPTLPSFVPLSLERDTPYYTTTPDVPRSSAV